MWNRKSQIADCASYNLEGVVYKKSVEFDVTTETVVAVCSDNSEGNTSVQIVICSHFQVNYF